MKRNIIKRITPDHIILWAARILSILSIGTVLMFFIGEGWTLSALKTLQNWILFFFFPIGVCLGMALSWRFKGLGVSITLVSLLLFYVIHRLTSSYFPGPAFIVLASPGFFFLVHWWRLKNKA